MELRAEIEKILFSGNEPEIIVDRLVKLVEGNFTINRKAKDGIKKVVSAEVETWIDEWLDIFPVGVKSGSKLVRSDRNMCLKKMVDVMLSTKYTKEEILRATKEYVNSFKENGYMYMKCATYFINKEREGSELIAMCDKLRSTKIREIVADGVTQIDYFV